ncbi:glutathionylspermidine synthase family protein [Clostridium sp. D2Q-11]|uniref:Glutathionylspermidine synthase family protein n=1 Tax=Anaeromonas frigoriresistens TaxID=2683708 RepID=A0A942Z980_9FIRM|nr:glutathionylspermidine synthase family protein [Anaeromonas frigoriresistens]MBS4539048.1 glutathionylspermidine synthase family protein [Anaeromonas frigoriresistens]
MNRKQIDKQYINMILENKEEYYKDYIRTKERVKDSKATYKGQPVPFLYMPKFYTDEDIENFRNLTTVMSSIFNKVIDKFLQDENYRLKFKFPNWINDLILLPKQYDSYFPMARFDIFYDYDGNFKFCEINTDGTSAMNEERELSRVFMDSKGVEDFKEEFNFEPFELFETWIDEVLNIYKEKHTKSNPAIAIVDFVSKSSMEEFIEFRDRFRKRGLWCEIISPDELEYKDGYLYSGNKMIDIVYRRLVTKDLMDNKDDINDFIEGIKSSNTTIIGPLKSQIVHNKIIFKILQEEETLNLLTEEERNFVIRHIPFTKELDLANLDIDEIIKNKGKYIIKPMDFYASKGVYAGKEHSKEKWEQYLKQCNDNNYLIQEYFNPPETEMIDFEEGSTLKSFKNITGLYIYNENFYGVYSRVGKKAIISGIHDGYTLPTFHTRKKG